VLNYKTRPDPARRVEILSYLEPIRAFGRVRVGSGRSSGSGFTSLYIYNGNWDGNSRMDAIISCVAAELQNLLHQPPYMKFRD